MYAARSNVRFFGTSYFQANQATENGGGIYARENSHVTLHGVNNFEHNLAERGGGIGLQDSTLMDTVSNRVSCFTKQHSMHSVAVNSFNTKHAASIGRGIFATNGTANLQGMNLYIAPPLCTEFHLFSGNAAIRTGGGVYASDSNLHLPGGTTFTNNSAPHYGGGLAAILCKLVNMSGSTNMKWNSAHSGGAMYIIYDSRIYIDGSNMRSNSAYSGGAMYIDDSTVHIDGNNCFHDNKATSEGGVLHVTKSTVTLNGTNIFKTNMAEERGGSSFTKCSDLIFNNNNLFQLSISRQGAAVCDIS